MRRKERRVGGMERRREEVREEGRKGRASTGHRSMCYLAGGKLNFCLIKSFNYSAKEEVNHQLRCGSNKKKKKQEVQGYRRFNMVTVVTEEHLLARASPLTPLLLKNQGFLGLGCDRNLQGKSYLPCF